MCARMPSRSCAVCPSCRTRWLLHVNAPNRSIHINTRCIGRARLPLALRTRATLSRSQAAAPAVPQRSCAGERGGTASRLWRPCRTPTRQRASRGSDSVSLQWAETVTPCKCAMLVILPGVERDAGDSLSGNTQIPALVQCSAVQYCNIRGRNRCCVKLYLRCLSEACAVPATSLCTCARAPGGRHRPIHGGPSAPEAGCLTTAYHLISLGAAAAAAAAAATGGLTAPQQSCYHESAME